MDDSRSRLQRALTWLEATPAEAAGLLLLLAGAVLATGLLVWQAGQRPEPSPPPGTGSAADPFPTDPADVGGPDDAVADVAAAPHAHHDTAPGPIVVHVTGAVARPGVVTLTAGDRVTDAIAAAGGATGDARLELVNLARALQDGEHVHLPRDGEEPPTGADGGVMAGPGTTGPGSGGLIDLNHATAEQLQRLPGIGPSKAAAILRHRDEHGPFAVPGDLRDVPGIGEATFQRLADLVTVS